MLLTIPTLLTLTRIALIPVFLVVFYLPVAWSSEAAAFLFAFAAVTDWLDGFLARRWGQETRFGAFLDPVADKLMVAVALILLVQADPSPALAVSAAVIVGREITISALREWMAELGERTHVAVSVIGKIKTTAQFVAITFMLYATPGNENFLYGAGFTLLYVASVLTLWSMVVYLRAAWPSLTRD